MTLRYRLSSMFEKALALYVYGAFVLVGIGFLPPMAWTALVARSDPSCRLRGRMMRRFGRTMAQANLLWRFHVEGTAPADILVRPYVVICNHESNIDPFLLSLLRWDMRWIAKQELYHLPLIGWLMRLGGDIPLRRGDSQSVRQMLDACRDTLRAGLPIMLFPEGTRSRDGSLLPFKDGAFQLAIDAGVPVLPLALAGTRHCMHKGSMRLARAQAAVRILEPIPTHGMTSDDVPQLRDLCRERIQQAVLELRARVEPAPESEQVNAYP